MELSSEKKKQSVLYCHKCGTKATANVTVCANCGTKLGNSTSTIETTGSFASLTEEKDESNNSRIVYFRPRGVEGNYKLGVILGLLPTEKAEIWRYYRERGFDPRKDHELPAAKFPVHRAGKLISTTTVFILTKFAAYQYFRIIITDEDVYSPQETYFIASQNSIIKEHPLGRTYIQKEDLKKIALYDLDELGLTPGQENAIVEAETNQIATIRHLLLAPEDKGKQKS